MFFIFVELLEDVVVLRTVILQRVVGIHKLGVTRGARWRIQAIEKAILGLAFVDSVPISAGEPVSYQLEVGEVVGQHEKLLSFSALRPQE